MSELSAEVINNLNRFKEPVDKAEHSHYLKACIYGDGGVGKTALSLRFGKTNMFSTDSGWTTALNNLPFSVDVDKTDYQNPQHLLSWSKAVRDQVEGFDHYDMVVLDTAGGAVENYLTWLLENMDLPKRPTATFKSPQEATKYKGKLEASGMDDYNFTKHYMLKVVKNLLAAPTHTIFITHERPPDFMGVRPKITPDLPDAVYYIIMKNCQLLGRMTRSGNKRYLSFEGSTLFTAKSRIQELDGEKVTDEEFVNTVNKWLGR